MHYRKTENTMSLLGGALLGAAAMYLLDPEMGKRRRAYVADRASDAMDSTTDALQSGWSKVSDRAGDVTSTLGDKAREYSQRLSDAAQDYGSRLKDHASNVGSSLSDNAQDYGDDLMHRARKTGSGWRDRLRDIGATIADRAHLMGKHASSRMGSSADDYADRASDVADNVTEYTNHLWDQVRHLGKKVRSRASDMSDDADDLLPREHSTPVLPITATALGCAALGLGAMYLMDPRLGRSRRAWLSDKVQSLVRQTGKSFYHTGRHVANRAYGAAHEVSGQFQSGNVPSEQLLNRVRSEMGRVCSHPRLIQVMTDANGAVTLTGRVLTSEAATLIGTVESVPGVSVVINRLETVSGEQELHQAASSSTQNIPTL